MSDTGKILAMVASVMSFGGAMTLFACAAFNPRFIGRDAHCATAIAFVLIMGGIAFRSLSLGRKQ